MNTRLLDRTAPRSLARRLIASATLATFVAMPPSAIAGLADIANAPISSAATTTMPPNVMFVLDDSGSMGSDFMPDDMDQYEDKVSFVATVCNTIYYNPAVTYQPPKNADGTDFSAANTTFAAAKNDGYLGTATTNLSNSFKGTNLNGTERAFYYKWNSAALPTFNECRTSAPNASRSTTHTSGNWVKVQLPVAEEQNFANWYSYYRTRMNVMKSAAGRAFNGLNDSFRVGFLTICPSTSWNCQGDWGTRNVDAAKYLKIDAFTPTHKTNWYAKFYSQSPSAYTPLREALSRVGRHYAKKTDGLNQNMNDDPIQYSCQQNYAILTTDGYWNYGKGRIITGTSTGTATQVGDQDADIGLTPRPMLDAGTLNTVLDQEYYSDIKAAGANGCSATQRRADRYTRTQTTGQSGSATTSNWVRVSDNVCFAKATIDAIVTAGCTSSGSPCDLGTSTASSGSVGDTLADVAEYYYRTDLRPAGSTGALGTLVDTNNVPASGSGTEDDKAQHQHMTTFTLGMGLSGTLKFDPNYKTQTSGDFTAIRNGTKGWPDPVPATTTTGDLNIQAARIDDLWHAAANGRGTYFSASDPATLALLLQTALSQIQTRLAAAAAAATSNLEPTQEDRLIFTPKYTTNEWSGDVEARELDITTGTVQSTIVWSARNNLLLRTKAACDDRKIYLYRKGATDGTVTTNYVPFTWNTAACDGAGNPVGTAATDLDAAEQEYFTNAGAYKEPTDLSQWSSMTDGTILGTVNQQAVAPGANLVNFVRGQRGLEGFVINDLTKLYRARKSVLGDIVNSQPIYVRSSFFDYVDPGYRDTFVPSVAARKPMLYVASNDGMLHAFAAGEYPTYAGGGDEAWAFIPRAVLPRLYKLADNNYANLHEYSVDGKPVSAEVYDTATSTWRTLLVAGLNKGGRAYYALDITDPTKPKALWEFGVPAACPSTDSYSDCDIGYTYGNPVVTKLAPSATYPTGKWVVLATSGYNNVAPGDGKGYLYVIDAMTGAKLDKIATGVGDTSTPSGLSKISASVTGNPNQDNTSSLVYGVDLLGNVWRFDVNNSFGVTGTDASLLATVRDPSGNPQPITTRPELAGLGSPPEPFVIVATGRYFGASDVANKQVQSIYAFRDPLTTTPYGLLRTVLKQNVMTTQGLERFVACDTTNPAANCGSKDGWFVDLPDPGERVNVDVRLQLGTLVAVTNVPGNSACEPGGYSYKVYFDFATGLSPAGATYAVGSKFSNALAVGINIVRLPDGRVIVIGMDSTGAAITFQAPVGSGQALGKRVTWREIIQ